MLKLSPDRALLTKQMATRMTVRKCRRRNRSPGRC